MRIESLQKIDLGSRSRVSAVVVWENRDRPSQEIYIETTDDFAADLSCNPHTFVLACIMLAFHYGEHRLWIDAEICPQLREGLITAMSWLQHWHQCDRPLVQIEAKSQSTISQSPAPRAGLFFSGGIDALAALRNNRLTCPSSHPHSIRDGLLVYGIANTTLENFEQARTTFEAIASDADLSLIPVYTNIYSHVKDLEYEDYKFWRYYFAGAALSAIAHAFHGRITTVSISASDVIQYLTPWGTHPLIDPNYSSHDLTIRYVGVEQSRFNKTQVVADWPIALQTMRVCDELVLPAGYLNCGHCEKCILTMTGLTALGVLEKTPVFPTTHLSAQLLVANAHPTHPDDEADYLEALPFLESRGRHDLVMSIRQVSRRYRLKRWLKDIDYQFFWGFFSKIHIKYYLLTTIRRLKHKMSKRWAL